MEITRMSSGITKIINERYADFIDNECIDIVQIKNICNLYKNKNKSKNIKSITLSELIISSPDLKKTVSRKSKNQYSILKTEEFEKKYNFFVKIIYSCLKMNIDIFDVNENVLTLKNNYELNKALVTKKKQILLEHMSYLKKYYKKVSQEVDTEYESYVMEYITKIKIIERIKKSINKLINTGVLSKSDNMLTLILPYFYKYTEFIEQYA